MRFHTSVLFEIIASLSNYFIASHQVLCPKYCICSQVLTVNIFNVLFQWMWAFSAKVTVWALVWTFPSVPQHVSFHIVRTFTGEVTVKAFVNLTNVIFLVGHDNLVCFAGTVTVFTGTRFGRWATLGLWVFLFYTFAITVVTFHCFFQSNSCRCLGLKSCKLLRISGITFGAITSYENEYCNYSISVSTNIVIFWQATSSHIPVLAQLNSLAEAAALPDNVLPNPQSHS